MILLQNIKGLGRIGDIKNVSDGYARNMLFTKGLAKVATQQSMKEVSALKKQAELSTALEKEEAEKAAIALDNATITFTKKASSTGKLFSSLAKLEIAKQLSELAEMKVTGDMLDLGEHGEHLKHTGEHSIAVDLGEGIRAKVNIKIEAE